MDDREYKIIEDPVYGFKRLDPIPQDDELEEFYQSRYYDLIRKAGRGPDIRRMMAGGKQAECEQQWLQSTLYNDVLLTLDAHAPGKRFLDVGCGTGELLTYMKEQGYDTVGLEPSSDAACIAQEKGLLVYDSGLGGKKQPPPDQLGMFDAVMMINVLEHLPRPVETLERIKELLNPHGIVGIRVPNDFNLLQEIVREKTQKEPWWIAMPDHISYFDFVSLAQLLESLDFETIYAQSDFPMEFFLLMGEDYIGSPEKGSDCHHRRVKFEMDLPGDVRRKLYRSFAQLGIGRNCLLFGKLKST